VYLSAAAVVFLGACSSNSTTAPTIVSQENGSSGTSGSTGTGGNNNPTTGTTGTGGDNTTGTTGTGGSTNPTGTGGSAGTPTTDGGAGGSGQTASRPINVTGSGTFSKSFNGQPLYFNHDKKPVRGKLVLLLPGIGTGTGAGGFESFVKMYGFHVFGPKTDTNLTGGDVPQMYKDTAKANPTDHEANRQVGDARMELWDGKDRVSWYMPPMSIVDQTLAAIKYAMEQDAGGDWGYFLNDDGTLRTSDVWVVGYSWGSQSWSMMSTYVHFGRVIATSGPVNEGFPNGTWMTDPSATPNDAKYALVSDGQAAEIFPNCMKAGWVGDVVKVTPTSTGPYTADQHLFEMVGGNGGTTPGGHTVFCNDNPMNGWWPVCKHVLDVE
jgi:hypothetical protein